MPLYRNDRNGDVVTVPAVLVDKYDATGHWSPVTPADTEPVPEPAPEPVKLTGAALADALSEAGLSAFGGTADEKRELLSEHDA